MLGQKSTVLFTIIMVYIVYYSKSVDFEAVIYFPSFS